MGITIVSVNDQPALTPLDSLEYEITEDVPGTENEGISTADLWAGLSVTDNDADSVTGIAIRIPYTASGVWQVSSTTPVAWSTFSGDANAVASNMVLVLEISDTWKIRFAPSLHFNGNVNLMLGAWDQTDGRASGAVTPLDLVNTATDVSPFSIDAQELVMTVYPFNDSPELQIFDLNLGSVNEDISVESNSGMTLQSLIVPAITDVDHQAQVGLAVIQSETPKAP